ncbi:MAG: MATE family efflux transporter [Oscillospiraceae bacterium]|nr:MATE family efflux transporter [Oscillospiraceae bacterium]
MRLNTRTMDMTSGSVLRCIILFSIPIFIGSFLQEMYTTFDTLIVGNTLGVDKLAAVGSTSSLVFLVTGFIMGCNNGASVPISHAIGAGDNSNVRRSIAAQLLMCLSEAVLFTLVFSSLAKPLLRLINTPANIYASAYRYLLIIYLGLTATAMYNMLAAVLRSLGDSRTPLLFLVFSSLLNIGLDFLFIVSFHWDVVGAAAATVLSQLISVILCLLYALRRFPEYIPQKDDFSGIGSQIRDCLKMGIPMGLQTTMISLGVLVLAGVLNGFGSTAVAANSIGMRVQRTTELISNSLAAGITVFVGQNFGAKRFDRIQEGVKKSWLLDLILFLVLPAIVFVLRKNIAGLFVEPTDDLMAFFNIHVLCLCPTMWVLSFLHVYRAAIIGLGHGFAAFLAGIPELIMRAVVSLIFAPIIGYAAVVLTGPFSWVFSAIPCMIVYFHSMKKHMSSLQAN